jgi:DNA mismatch repair protein MutS
LLELEDSAQRHAELQQSQLPLFDAEPACSEVSAVEQLLHGIEPDELTPREALEAIYRLQGLLQEKP